ncbi:hypothetical protein [Nonomuraea diastatica]|uniref:ABC transporter permease n=1 Tax=Nonomuraea diastatica TaxID=1848329 RepID=A0A4R4WGQ6_9ACTN|nr:hypothetical protein [Nonomuraea diastatica]TDD15493.1 hypothetical protein E1294_34310 [Nonomuraea diastatica]
MNACTGTGHLVRLYLRRDRITATGWTLFLALLVAGMLPYYGGIFTTEEARLTPEPRRSPGVPNWWARE